METCWACSDDALSFIQIVHPILPRYDWRGVSQEGSTHPFIQQGVHSPLHVGFELGEASGAQRCTRGRGLQGPTVIGREE